MTLLKKAYEVLFVVGIFIIPFNSFTYRIPAMGEFSRESAIIFLLLGVLCFFIHTVVTGKFYYPKRSLLFKILTVFIGWCVIATLINLPYLFESVYKTIFGYERFFRQFIGLMVSIVLFIFYYNVLHDKNNQQILCFIRRIFLASFVVVSIYGLLEIAIIQFNASFLNPVIDLFNYFPFVNVWVDVEQGRISSVTFEPPTLAMYLITVAGWMFSFVLTHKNKWWRFIPAVMVLILAYYSKSRTAQAVILVQVIAFMYFYIRENKISLTKALGVAGIAVATIFTLFLSFSSVRDSVEESLDGFDFKKNLTSSVSNQSRLGIQVAAFEVFKDHPISGVGYGQTVYHMRPYYPDWATRGNYEFRIMYLKQSLQAFPPIYNWYTRLLSETGIIGLLLFLTFTLWLFYSLWNAYITTGNNILQIILFVSFVGYFINWLQVDTPRVFGFWLCLAIIMPRKKALNESE